MTDKQLEALRLADRLESHSTMETRDQAANLLRAQLVTIEHKNALLRQALEALDKIGMENWVSLKEDARESIRKELQ